MILREDNDNGDDMIMRIMIRILGMKRIVMRRRRVGATTSIMIMTTLFIITLWNENNYNYATVICMYV
mgnify:CR=1 FL=1